MSNFYKRSYLSQWLVKALRLPATPALLCGDGRYSDSWPTQDVTNIEFDLCCLFIGGENGNTPKKPPRLDQKAAKNCSYV